MSLEPAPQLTGREDRLVEDPAAKASVLMEALRYIRQWSGKTMVMKVGGEIIETPAILDAFATDVTLMRLVGMNPVIVHGGGPQISDVMTKFGKAPMFVEGRRVTDPETMQIVKMVLIGQINKGIVTAINQHGCSAAGISGEDARLLEAERAFGPGGEDLGQVGDVRRVNSAIVDSLLAGEFVPVIAPIGTGEGGPYNINADQVAGAVARSLKAEKLIFLTNVKGLLGDLQDESSLISEVEVSGLERLLESGSLSAGMIPKISSLVSAMRAGVRRGHILDGRIRHALLLEIFTDHGSGTMVTP